MALKFTANRAAPSPYFHSILIPVDAFLKAFKNPVLLGERIEGSAKRVCAEWETLNGDALSAGQRTPIEASYTLWRLDWKSNFQPQFGEVELQVKVIFLSRNRRLIVASSLGQLVWFHRE